MENENNNVIMTEEDKKALEDKNKNIFDPEIQIKRFGSGKMVLAEPIRAGGADVKELKFDFTRITGMEYVEAMDSDTKAANTFRISATQAITLFSIAAAKETEGIDAIDIRDRIGVQDCLKAVQLSTIFFTAVNRAGNKRISNE